MRIEDSTVIFWWGYLAGALTIGIIFAGMALI